MLGPLCWALKSGASGMASVVLRSGGLLQKNSGCLDQTVVQESVMLLHHQASVFSLALLL